MTYQEFTLRELRKAFALDLIEDDLFARVDPLNLSTAFGQTIKDQAQLASAICTDKARSELIVTPILLEARRRMDGRVGFFSGVEFEVDPDRGLAGTCDFLMTRDPRQLFVQDPSFAIAMARNEDIIAGLGPCAAVMIAARIFNEREAGPAGPIHGCVTSGTFWRFLRLEGASLSIDRREYSIGEAGTILAILLHCVGGGPR